MNPSDVSEYIIEGMKWLAVGGVIYIGTLYGICATHRFSQKIKSQEELDIIVEEEANKLGLDLTTINVIYSSSRTGVRRKGEGYEFHLEQNLRYSNRATVRHELYHIYKGDAKNDTSMSSKIDIKYLFLEEPKALIYGSLKIKL